MTNHRISVFNQDVIPHILRTKLIPALEDEENGLQQVGKEFEQSNKTFDVNSYSIYIIFDLYNSLSVSIESSQQFQKVNR